MNNPKLIGTVNSQEVNNFTTLNPWESVTKPELPYSVLSKPTGFMFTHGSACGSLPTTSIQGYTYGEDIYVFRQEGTAVDVDRYLGSITPQNTLAVLKIPSGKIPFHHLNPTHEIIKALPTNEQKQILSILEKQNP